MLAWKKKRSKNTYVSIYFPIPSVKWFRLARYRQTYRLAAQRLDHHKSNYFPPFSIFELLKIILMDSNFDCVFVWNGCSFAQKSLVALRNILLLVLFLFCCYVLLCFVMMLSARYLYNNTIRKITLEIYFIVIIGICLLTNVQVINVDFVTGKFTLYTITPIRQR